MRPLHQAVEKTEHFLVLRQCSDGGGGGGGGCGGGGGGGDGGGSGSGDVGVCVYVCGGERLRG